MPKFARSALLTKFNEMKQRRVVDGALPTERALTEQTGKFKSVTFG
jgi:hypothetical protein